MLCGNDKVLIVGMDFAESVFLRAREVEGVRGTKENFCRKDGEVFRGFIEQGRRRVEPGPQARRVIRLELGNEALVCGQINLRLSQLPVKGGGKFQSTEGK